MNYKTEQESFWAGQFGSEYVSRNSEEQLVSGSISFFSKVLERTDNVGSIIEFGANIGVNLVALKGLRPSAEISAIEINPDAARILRSKKWINVYETSILDFETEKSYDLAFIRGVLIHINPEFLADVYRKLYQASDRYIMVAEYYNPVPVELNYRGHAGRLFKRDFAGEMLDMFPDLKLVDYGFVYHRDNNFPQDDITWFLMEKRGR